MKIQNSICVDCKYFEHECGVPVGDDDYMCSEYCYHPDQKIKENFHDEYDIEECDGWTAYE